MSPLRRLVLLAALCLTVLPLSAREMYEFNGEAERARFTQLTNELRCLVCQGQSIADSNAELAVDLREKVHEMIVAGATDAEIRRFMTDRYGDFVLFRPPVKAETAPLWLAPAALGVVAVGLAVLAASRRRRRPAAAPLSEEERVRLRELGVTSREDRE